MNLKSIKSWLPATLQIGLCAVGIALPLLVACGGKMSPGDTPSTAAGTAPFEATGTENFLVFPNPLANPAIDTWGTAGTYEDTYYNMIDPLQERTTLAAWKHKNGFDGSIPGGEQFNVVFGDTRDLGYGRNMTARWNDDDTWAFMVDNYSVAPSANYAYNHMNVEAAIAQDKRWYGGTNAIEVSPGPNCDTVAHPIPNGLPECKYIVKFYNFDPATGDRNKYANLDGLGNKALPGICISCHGGRGDEVLPPSSAVSAASNPYYATHPEYGVNIPALLPQYYKNGIRGDVKGRLHAFEVGTFDFSNQPGYTRADQEANLKKLNQWVLCTYPMPTGTPPLTAASAAANVNQEDNCRQYNTNYPFVESSVANVSAGLTPSYIYPVTDMDDWQSPAAAIIKQAYGGDGMPNATFSDTYVPPGWQTVGQTDLYNNVVKPACRVCHLLRGSGTTEDSWIAFNSFYGFQNFADRIKYHVIDRGNMPLSRIVFDRFWSTPSMYNSLAQFLQSSNPVVTSMVSYTVTDSNGALLRPGHPIANPGPDRVIGTSSTQLSAQYSLYADSYTWTVTGANAANATVYPTTGLQTTFTALAAADDTYHVQLVASKGGINSDPFDLTIVVKKNSWPANILASTTSVSNP